MAKTLVQKIDVVVRVIRTTFALTLCVQKENALTVLAHEVDGVARIICTTYALTLCVWKKFPLTFCVCKTRAVSRRQMP